MSLWIYKKLYRALSSQFKAYIIRIPSLLISLLLSSIIYAGIFTFLRYYLSIFNSNLEGGILSALIYILTYIMIVGDMTMIFGYWFENQEPKTSKKYIGYLIKNTMASLLVSIIALLGMDKLTHYNTINHPMQEGVIYITHSPKCKYCTISDKNRQITSFIYQLSHKLETDIIVVNVDEDNELTRDIKTHLDGRGSVITKQNDHIIQKVYTLGKDDEYRTPIEASVNHIYTVTNDVQQLMRAQKKAKV